MKVKWARRLHQAAVVVFALSLMMSPGCTGAILDAAGAGALSLLQGSVSGVGSILLFGEEPPSLLFNSLLNAVGSTGGGGGAHH